MGGTPWGSLPGCECEGLGCCWLLIPAPIHACPQIASNPLLAAMLDLARSGLLVEALTAAAAALSPLCGMVELPGGGTADLSELLSPELAAQLMPGDPSLTPMFMSAGASTPFGTFAAAGQLAGLGAQHMPLALPLPAEARPASQLPLNKRQRGGHQ